MSLLLHPPLPKSLTLERASQQRFKACPPFRSLIQTCSLDTAVVLLEILGNNLLTLVQITGYALPGLLYQTWFCTGDGSVSFWEQHPGSFSMEALAVPWSSSKLMKIWTCRTRLYRCAGIYMPAGTLQHAFHPNFYCRPPSRKTKPRPQLTQQHPCCHTYSIPIGLAVRGNVTFNKPGPPHGVKEGRTESHCCLTASSFPDSHSLWRYGLEFLHIFHCNLTAALNPFALTWREAECTQFAFAVALTIWCRYSMASCLCIKKY